MFRGEFEFGLIRGHGNGSKGILKKGLKMLEYGKVRVYGIKLIRRLLTLIKVNCSK